jgi:hypothetical protein
MISDPCYVKDFKDSEDFNPARADDEGNYPYSYNGSCGATLSEAMGGQLGTIHGVVSSTVRNTLDLGAVALAKRESHLPVIVDPSQAAGRADLVIALSRAAVAVGADGILVEVHPNPAEAKSDGQQQLDLTGIQRLAEEIAPFVQAAGRAG